MSPAGGKRINDAYIRTFFGIEDTEDGKAELEDNYDQYGKIYLSFLDKQIDQIEGTCKIISECSDEILA